MLVGCLMREGYVAVPAGLRSQESGCAFDRKLVSCDGAMWSEECCAWRQEVEPEVLADTVESISRRRLQQEGTSPSSQVVCSHPPLPLKASYDTGVEMPFALPSTILA